MSDDDPEALPKKKRELSRGHVIVSVSSVSLIGAALNFAHATNAGEALKTEVGGVKATVVQVQDDVGRVREKIVRVEGEVVAKTIDPMRVSALEAGQAANAARFEALRDDVRAFRAEQQRASEELRRTLERLLERR
jgi:predicted  nucleic acid-binding Zn-ribbon protein